MITTCALVVGGRREIPGSRSAPPSLVTLGHTSKMILILLNLLRFFFKTTLAFYPEACIPSSPLLLFLDTLSCYSWTHLQNDPRPYPFSTLYDVSLKLILKVLLIFILRFQPWSILLPSSRLKICLSFFQKTRQEILKMISKGTKELLK